MRSHSTAYEPNPHKTVRILIIIFVLFDLAVLSTQKSFLVDVFGLFFSRHTQSHTHCFMPFTAEKLSYTQIKYSLSLNFSEMLYHRSGLITLWRMSKTMLKLSFANVDFVSCGCCVSFYIFYQSSRARHIFPTKLPPFKSFA